jgi:hypothetical protein
MVLDRRGIIISKPVLIIVSSMDNFSEHVLPVLTSVGISTFCKYRLNARRLLSRRSLIDLTLNLDYFSKERDFDLTSIEK